MALSLIGVPAHRFTPDLRAKIEPFLSKFTNRGQVTTDDLVKQIKSRTRQLWLVAETDIRAVLLTQIDSDLTKTCRITHLTGVGRKEWEHLFPKIEDWARSQGCTRFEALARPGWSRIGQRYGLKSTHVLLEKDL